MLPDAGLGLSAVLAGAFAVLLGLSVLAHELGHCLVALRFGMPVRRVRLFLLGGLSELVRSPRRPQQEALVALAGPGVSIALALVCWVLLAIPADGAVAAGGAVRAVGPWAKQPASCLPLDGGRR